MSDPPATATIAESKFLELTPPTTPTCSYIKSISDTLSITPSVAPDGSIDVKTSTFPTAEETISWATMLPQLYKKSYKRLENLGHGAWSTVYRAAESEQTQPSPLATPPVSPASSSRKSDAGRILAIKTAARRDAREILYQEARILTFLHDHDHASEYIVPFHGYDATTQSLVMDAIPLDLDTHARSCLGKIRNNFTTATMLDPVCGVQDWQSLAVQLIDGLAFLHNQRCVHGDIKPANILLRPNAKSSAYTPLYCDFSSSRILDDRLADTEASQQVTALTPDFASPELIESLHTTAAVATTASDIYALGVTLVVAAIGESPYAGARMEMQKLGMARQGRVLEFARQADQGTRIMGNGKRVERCLRSALERDARKRSTVKVWKGEVREILGEMK
ncbi:MAG: hypothetical protein Q9222_001590 [Ikaeria aurantiellina]